MGSRTFKNGVHPFEGKELSKDAPVKAYLPQGEMVYPLSQHIGAPAKPVVSVGDTVLKGQMIAEPGGFVSAGIFSSVSGKVTKIAPHRVATGDMVNSIHIENDGLYTEVEYNPCKNLDELSASDIIERVMKAGVVGMGGAGFPTHVKLSPKDPDKIDYIIANCAECEPYLTSDYRRMMDNPELLIGGMRIVLRCFPNAKGVLGIEDNKPDCIKKLKELCKNEPRIEVCPLQTKYPQGGERQLIYAVTKRAINSTMLPADAGCIVDNVETLVCIYRAVIEGKPVMGRIFTVTGDAIVEPRNFEVLTGTSYKELLEAAGGLKAPAEKIISGGPMMGFSMFDLDVPITKTNSSLLALTKDEVSQYEPGPCINCGRCVEACPELLVPSKLAKMADLGLGEDFEKWNGMECVECGSCSYGCPARRQLTQSIKTMKKNILAERRKASAK